VRRALGAGQAAIARDLVVEAFLLSALGGGLGLVLAAGGVVALRSSRAVVDLPRRAMRGGR
jgi:ABC-type antimicrobial peptide transport system permease subunit